MKHRYAVIAILAAFGAASWLLFRVPPGADERKGELKERVRAAEAALHTLDAARAVTGARRRLADEEAAAKGAASFRAAAALPHYRAARAKAEAALAARRNERRSDGPANGATGDAALLGRLDALLR